MHYVLECRDEFDRLERQSRTEGYDFRAELGDLLPPINSRRFGRILDAGCGSGIVARHLAEVYPSAQVIGCDVSETRLQDARAASGVGTNLSFERANLEKLPFPTGHFDLIVCRFVMQHMRPGARAKALSELHRCLKPGGLLKIVDIDGAFFNMHPMPKSLVKPMQALFSSPKLDFYVGRKLPTLLCEAGFGKVAWDIQTLNFRGELLETEIRLNSERFDQMASYLVSVLGSKAAAESFKRRFDAAWKKPGAVMFYNKFLITAQRGSPELVKS